MAIEGSEPLPGVIVPCLVVADVDEAMRFYQTAFGAEELYRSPCAGGVGVHVNLRIWNSLVCLAQEEPQVRADRVEYSMLASPETLGGSTCIFQVRVPDADEAFERAVRSGAAPTIPPSDMFWGDRYGLVQDPFGYMWAITTVQEVLKPAEIATRLSAAAGGR
ncbi:PhnB domain protein [Candidatus Sulfopaludibacter sp. SbA4]|nr:PhnB domain protein [Candidatus Sulfopaludibacter sp. SbA4]